MVTTYVIIGVVLSLFFIDFYTPYFLEAPIYAVSLCVNNFILLLSFTFCFCGKRKTIKDPRVPIIYILLVVATGLTLGTIIYDKLHHIEHYSIFFIFLCVGCGIQGFLWLVVTLVSNKTVVGGWWELTFLHLFAASVVASIYYFTDFYKQWRKVYDSCEARETCHTCLAAPCGVPNAQQQDCNNVCYWNGTGCLAGSDPYAYPDTCDQEFIYEQNIMVLFSAGFGIVISLLFLILLCLSCFRGKFDENLPLLRAGAVSDRCGFCRHLKHHGETCLTLLEVNHRIKCQCEHEHHVGPCTQGYITTVAYTEARVSWHNVVSPTLVAERVRAAEIVTCACTQCNCRRCYGGLACSCSRCDCKICSGLNERLKAPKRKVFRAFSVLFALFGILCLIDAFVFMFDYSLFAGTYNYLFEKNVYYDYSLWVFYTNALFTVGIVMYTIFSIIFLVLNKLLYEGQKQKL